LCPWKKGASQMKGASKVKKTAKGAKAKAAAPKKAKAGAKGKKPAGPERKPAAPRAESKGARILEMIARTKGAALAEIMKATDWQAHSVRGASRKHSVKIESARNDAGERVYRSPKWDLLAPLHRGRRDRKPAAFLLFSGD